MTSIAHVVQPRVLGQQNSTPPDYDNDQLSDDALTKTVARARALGIPVDLLDTARPTERATLISAIDDAWASDYRLSYTESKLAKARSEQGAKWPLIPGVAGGALLGAVTGCLAGEAVQMLRPGADVLSLGVALAIGGAMIIGTALGVRAIVNHDTDVEVRELVDQQTDRRALRDAAVAEARAIAAG